SRKTKVHSKARARAGGGTVAKTETTVERDRPGVGNDTKTKTTETKEKDAKGDVVREEKKVTRSSTRRDALPAPISARQGRRGDGRVALAAFFQRAGDEARRLHLLDERTKVARGTFASSGQAHRLFDRHEPAFDDAHAWVALRELDQRLFHPGDRFELLPLEQVDRARRCRRAQQSGLLQRASP